MTIYYIREKAVLKVTFTPTEMTLLGRLAAAIDFPLPNIGGLSKRSPYVLIRIEQLLSFAEQHNDDIDLVSAIFKYGIDKKISLLEKVPAKTREGYRERAKAAVKSLPQGFFMKKD